MSIADNILGVCLGGLVGIGIVFGSNVQDNGKASFAIIATGGLTGYFFALIVEQEKEKKLLMDDLEEANALISGKNEEIRKLKKDHPRIILERINAQKQHIHYASKRREEINKKELEYLEQLKNVFRNSVILPQETLVSEAYTENVEEIPEGVALMIVEGVIGFQVQ
jgi:hypothetical protein